MEEPKNAGSSSLKEPNQSLLFSKVINFNELEGEFHLDFDFEAKKEPYRSKDNEDLSEFKDMMIEDDDDDTDSEPEDVFKEAEKRTEQMMLSSPEYLSFEDLAAKMIDIPSELPGAVKISIINEGDGPLLPPDAVVTMHYSAYFEKATIPFDSTLNIKCTDGNPSQYRLGRHQILPGLEYALTAVRGPTAHLLALLQPEVTWGPNGIPPRIPPKPALFVIVLYSVMEGNAHDVFDFLPPAEQSKFETTARTVKSLREKARQLFQKKHYESATQSYKSAQHVISLCLPETDQQYQAVKELKVQVLVNMAVCYYKRQMPNRVLDICKCIDRIMDLNTHCKALFYRGKAYEMLGKFDGALENYKKALKLEPNNKEIGTLLAELDAKLRKSQEFEADMWKKVFHTKIEKKERFKVDEEFRKSVRELCEDLATRTEYTKVELQMGLGAEVACLRHEATRANLIVEENGEGMQRRVAIIKRIL